MSIPITCSCGQALSAPDDTAGGKFYCWSCGRPVPVPGAALPANTSSSPATSSASYAAAPTFVRSRPEEAPAAPRQFILPSGDWERVRSGLFMVNVGAAMFLLLVLAIWVNILDGSSGPRSESGFKSLILFITVMLGAGAVFGALGTVACVSVPEETGSKGPATFAALFMGGGAIGTVILCLILLVAILGNSPPHVSEGFGKFLQKLMMLGLQGGFLLFMFFQLLTALYLGERGLAAGIMAYHLMPIVFTAVSPLGTPLSPLAAMLDGRVGRGLDDSDIRTWLNLSMLLIVATIIWFMAINVMLRSCIESPDHR